MHGHFNRILLLCGWLWFCSPVAAQPPATDPDAQPQQQGAPAQQQDAPAQQREPAPDVITDNGQDQIVVPLSEPARRWIEEALRRQAIDPTAGPLSTGDPVLDDVLEVIRRQGSVLDGSALDPRFDQAPQQPAQRNDERFDPEPYRAPAAPYQGQPPAAPLPDGTLQAAQHPDARFHVAESLLRTARELAALEHQDATSGRLVNAMREQATMLLVDEYSQDADRFDPENTNRFE